MRSGDLFDLHHKVSYGVSLGHKHLVRHACGDMHHVAGLDRLACATFYGSAQGFAGAGRLGINDCATGHDGCVSVENVEQVGEVVMDLAAAVAVAEGKHGVVVRILFERLAGRAFSLRGQFAQMLCLLK